MTGRTLRTRNDFQRTRSLMFLVTSGTGFVLDHIRLMKGVLDMAGLTFSINRVESDAMFKAFPYHFLEFSGRKPPRSQE